MTKSTYRIFFLTIALSVVAAGVLTTRGNAWQQEPSAEPRRGHYSPLAVAIERAKAAAGVNEITIAPPQDMPTGVATVNELIRDYTLLHVIVRDAATLVGDYGLQTWYKLGVLEVLNRQATVPEEPAVEKAVGEKPLEAEPLLQRAPRRLVPLAQSGVFYIVNAGTAVVDGITVNESPVEAGLVLQKDRQYVGGFFLAGCGKTANSV